MCDSTLLLHCDEQPPAYRMFKAVVLQRSFRPVSGVTGAVTAIPPVEVRTSAKIFTTIELIQFCT